MDVKQINDALERVFNEEQARIVFWNDPDQEFLSFMNSLPMFFIHSTII